MRVQVSLSEQMVARVDKIAEDMGLSRSAVCNMFIGQGVKSMEKADNLITKEVILEAIKNSANPST